ncbi:MAG: transglycosylase domain-containing protein [Ktedonobacterales bacterium]
MDTTGRTSSPGTPEPEEHARDEHDILADGPTTPETGYAANMQDGPSAGASELAQPGASPEHDGHDADRDRIPAESDGHDAGEPHSGDGDEPTLLDFRDRPAAQHVSDGASGAPTSRKPPQDDDARLDSAVDASTPAAPIDEDEPAQAVPLDEEERSAVADEPTMALPPSPSNGASARTSRSRDAKDEDDYATHIAHERDRHGDDRMDLAGFDDDWPAIYMPSSRPLTPAQQRALFDGRRSSRRRRRYTMFMRRTARARQTAKSSTITRAAWASVIVMFGLIISVLTASIAAAASYYQSEYSLIKGLQHHVASRDSVRIYDSKGTLLYELRSDGAQHSITLANVPISVVNATVAIEDHEYWNNGGIDFVSIGRAAVANIQSHGVTQGGSTITQQLIKSQVLQDTSANFSRKLSEAILSVGMTYQGVYTKREILELYLNSIPYGNEAYGIDAAAQIYFGYQDDPDTGITAAQHLDLAQAAMLAGVPQNPNTNNPLDYPQKALDRMAEVLHAMVTYGYITQAQANAAYIEAQKPNFFHPTTQEQNKAPHFVYYVLDQLQNMIQTGQLGNLSRSGLSVYTTLDLDMQNQVQKYMKQHLYGNDRAGFPPFPYIRNANVTNSAAVMADHHTGDIKVMLGSVDYYSTNTKIDPKFNVATMGYRGPGSSFKPFVYATAFEKGWFPAMTVSDMPSIFWDEGAQKEYKPLDFTYNEFRGEITLRTALQFSLNIPAVKTMQFAGIDDVRRNVTRWGISPTVGTWGLSSVLGAIQATPFEMVQAYTVLANYGQYIPLHGINKIVDSNDDVLFQYHTPQPVQVLSPQVAYMVTSILEDNPSRADDFGACSPLYLDASKSDCYYYHGNSPNAWPAAAKTGTGQDFKDDWTMGFTMDYTLGVWVGNNNNTPMIDIDGITGAAPIWHNSMMWAEQNLPKRDFPVPSTGLHKARYCSNGICTTDWFLDGPKPPDNIGGGGPASVPCITFLDTGGWNYAASGQCDGTAHVKPVHY